MIKRDQATCERCFWAFPQDYDHIALQEIRRTDITWQGADVAVHDALELIAKREGITVADLLRNQARQRAKDS